jgi:hypothetical protein
VRTYQSGFVACLLAAASLAAAPPPSSQASPAPAVATPAPVAELGIALPAVGGRRWERTQKEYFNQAVMRDIRDNLHATYVRTGWIPDWFRFEELRWRREDQGLDAICSSGLKVMILIPSPKNDDKGFDHLVDDVGEFFSRYTLREFGCLRYAEVVNEADLPVNGFADVKEYAAFYARVAPVIAALGVKVITSGTSGKDTPWTWTLASIFRSLDPSPPVNGFGFHPYGVRPTQMADAVREMRVAAGAGRDASLPEIYVTEIAQTRADDLYQTIANLARVTPAITLYEYKTQPNEDPQYGLKNNPALYEAVQKAWASIHAPNEGALSAP